MKMTGADAAIASLEAQGLTTIFGVPGGHSVPLFDALSRRDEMRSVVGRHEQGLAYMADGYYRATGRIGVVSTTSGPGVAGLTSPLGGATTDTSGVLVVSSTVHSSMVGKNRGGLHDLNDALEMMRAVCGPVARCSTVAGIPHVIRDLVFEIRCRRPRAAFCEIPLDLMRMEDEVVLASMVELDRPQPDSDSVSEAVDLLAGASRPVLWTGTGALISGASDEVDQLARQLGAVVITSMLGQGLLPADHPNLVCRDGVILNPVNALIEEADVVLAVGTMFKQEDTAAWAMKPGASLIHLDIDPDEIGRSYPATVGLVADAKVGLAAILESLPERAPADLTWLQKARDAESKWVALWEERGPAERKAVDVFRAATPDDAIVYFDRCNLGYWAWIDFRVKAPRTFHYPMGYGAIGPALPQAIGGKIAAPDKPVVCVIGDGGFQFTGMELAVAVQEKTAITVVVCNNRQYGAITANMKGNFGHANLGCDIEGPDLVKFSAAYGIPATRVTSLDDFGPALSRGIQSGVLNLIDLQVDLMDPPWSG